MRFEEAFENRFLSVDEKVNTDKTLGFGLVFGNDISQLFFLCWKG